MVPDWRKKETQRAWDAMASLTSQEDLDDNTALFWLTLGLVFGMGMMCAVTAILL